MDTEKSLEGVKTFFEGLIDYFFDPYETDGGHQEVIFIIRNSMRARRLRQQLLPENSIDILTASGWGYKDYAAAIKAAIETWEMKNAAREGQFI